MQALHHSGVTLTIIDTASGVSAATTAAIRYADLCLIPARPSIADIEATAPTLSIVRAWNKPFAFVLNQTPIRGQRIGKSADCVRHGGDCAEAFRNDGPDFTSGTSGTRRSNGRSG